MPDAPPPPSSRSLPRGAADVDVVVIGGGVNGVGVARDATMRGLKVALFERNDLAFGASGNSSGMIHGGPRYLTYDPAVTETSCRDSGHIQAIAPHLLFRIPFLMPVERSARAKVMLTLMDGFFEAYDEFQPLKRGKPHARLTARRAARARAGPARGSRGRDVLRRVGHRRRAPVHGQRPRRPRARREDPRRHHHRVDRAQARQRRGGRGPLARSAQRAHRPHPTTAIVNATGAWAPITAALGGLEAKRARIRPGKGIHVAYDRRLTNYAIGRRRSTAGRSSSSPGRT
jgi:glycerol-3-phosphate dehydrogenase